MGRDFGNECNRFRKLERGIFQIVVLVQAPDVLLIRGESLLSQSQVRLSLHNQRSQLSRTCLVHGLIWFFLLALLLWIVCRLQIGSRSNFALSFLQLGLLLFLLPDLHLLNRVSPVLVRHRILDDEYLFSRLNWELIGNLGLD